MNADTQDKNERAEQLRQFKINVKSWMREHRVKASDIAAWTGKSVGTVKNWLYTPINITLENQKLISDFIRDYAKGRISLTGGGINTEDSFRTIGFIGLDLQELDLSADSSEYWCMAAEVKSDILNSTPNRYTVNSSHILFARWVTPLIMQHTSSVIAPKYQEAVKSGKKFDVSAYIKTAPSCIESIEIDNIPKIENPDRFKYIPVIKSEWKPLYLLAAAGIREQTPGQYILSILQEAAERMNDTNLREFLESFSDLSLD